MFCCCRTGIHRTVNDSGRARAAVARAGVGRDTLPGVRAQNLIRGVCAMNLSTPLTFCKRRHAGIHMTMTMSENGGQMNATMDGTSTYTYLGADCGDVKPSGQ